MKRITLLIPLILALILTAGCEPNADFWGDKATIIKKVQTEKDKEKHQAQYTIHFDGPYADWICVFQEKWGEVGDQVIGGTNHTIATRSKTQIKLEDESK